MRPPLPPVDPSGLRRDAERLLRSGGGARAIEAYRRLLAVAPERADDWFNLGYLQRHAGAWTDALDAYAQALARGTRGPEEVHLNRAVILSEHLFDADAAEAELRAALALRPDFVPALLNLASLQEDRGERDAARATYARVLAAEPGHPRALGRLAEMARPGEELEAALRPIDARLAARPPDDDRAELLFARGRALERLGRFGEAFAAVAEANALAGALAARAGWTYRAPERERMVGAVLAEPAGEPLNGGETPAPVFLCGMFRSGSTVMEQVLGAHGNVCAGGELDALPRLVAERLPRFPDGLAALSPGELSTMRDAYLAQAARLGCGERLLVDKRPDNFLYVGLAKRIFPSAKILITRRHPLDTVLSAYFLRFDDSVSYSFRLEDAAHWLVQERRLAAHWMRMFPGDVMEIDYDALVADPAGVVSAALRFLRLPWDDACLRFAERETVIRTPSGWQAREPLHARSSGRWRRYERELEPAAAILRRAGLLADA